MKRLIPLLLIAISAAAQVATYKELKYPPLKGVKIPEVVTATMPNGIRLYLLEDHELPLISGFALVRTGNLLDPPDKIGLAQITGTVMRTGGTETQTGDQLDELLENVAASVESSIGETSGRVSFSSLKENVDQALAVFQQVLTAPQFRQDKIDLAKTQMRSAIARRNDNADSVAAREFSDTVYGKATPYGWRTEIATVDAIERDDLVAFHRRCFFPANTMLVASGDFNAAEMRIKLERLLGGWNVEQSPVPPFPSVSEKASPGIYLAVKPDVTQTFFFLGHLGGVLRDKDYAALEVMADILGGGFRSRLVQRVRTELGYAYNVSAYWGANYSHPGLFTISGSTKSASTTETIEAVRQEVEKLRSTEVTGDELQAAKDSVLNSFVFNFDRPAKTLSRMVTLDYYGYPRDFLFQYQKAVAAVTKADVLRVAKEYIQPGNFTTVTVGKPDDFGKPLSALGLPVKEIELK
jgi:zinc protease